MLIDRRGFLSRGAAAAAGSYAGVLGARSEVQQDPRRPQWKLTTSEEYDPETESLILFFWMTLPDTLAVGPHDLRFRFTDPTTGEAAESSLPINIVGR
jgi:hypothetical protein